MKYKSLEAGILNAKILVKVDNFLNNLNELKINASCVEYSLYFIDEKGDKIGI